MKNKKLTLVSNNPSLLNDSIPFIKISASTNMDVINKCRDLIHQGAKLVTHPLAGSIKPWETPYRSIILQVTSSELDMNSLEMIEAATQKYQIHQSPSARPLHKPRATKQSELDFQLIDRELMMSAMKSLHIRI